jgi:hypothetical protein
MNIHALYPDLILLMTSYLDGMSIGRLGLTCKHFYNIVIVKLFKDPTWRIHHDRDFTFDLFGKRKLMIDLDKHKEYRKMKRPEHIGEEFWTYILSCRCRQELRRIFQIHSSDDLMDMIRSLTNRVIREDDKLCNWKIMISNDEYYRRIVDEIQNLIRKLLKLVSVMYPHEFEQFKRFVYPRGRVYDLWKWLIHKYIPSEIYQYNCDFINFRQTRNLK